MMYLILLFIPYIILDYYRFLDYIIIRPDWLLMVLFTWLGHVRKKVRFASRASTMLPLKKFGEQKFYKIPKIDQKGSRPNYVEKTLSGMKRVSNKSTHCENPYKSTLRKLSCHRIRSRYKITVEM